VQAHIKDALAYLRVLVNPRDEPAWRRLLLLLPGIGPSKAGAVSARLISAAEPLEVLATAETMALVPSKSKGFFAGFVADLNKIRATEPETHPSAAIAAILQGGYPATIRMKYDRPENRIADLEQFGSYTLSSRDLIDALSVKPKTK
jgi:DNA helicase-2/ATP-dependent DNA helicase PcrA